MTELDKDIIMAAADKISHDAEAFAVYMIHDSESIHFIAASKDEITSEKLYEISYDISAMLNHNVEVLDMGMFSIPDKVRIISNAALVHSENEFQQKLMETETLLAYQMHDREKNHIFERKKNYGSFYLQ